jgi:hypothetical protein
MSTKSTIRKVGFDIVSIGEAGSLVTVTEAGQILRISASSLNKWRLSGSGPRFIRVGARIRYRLSDLAAYLNQRTRNSTSSKQPPPEAT